MPEVPGGLAGRRASVNALTSVAQTVVSAALMFWLYHDLLRVVGPDGLGVWSVVLASTAAVRITELGLTGSAVKYVAAYLARGDEEAAARTAETTVTTVGVLIGVAAFAGFFALRALLPLFVPAEGLAAAQELLPYACVSFWLAAVAGAAQGGVEGCSRYDLRNVVLTLGQALYVGLALWWVRRDGLVGLALAQVVQGAALSVAMWAVLRRELPAAALVPWRWDRARFREMLGYGLRFQALGLLRMLYEPTTKALMSKFGGLALVGFYEMAGQLVLKLRALLVAAQQVMTPEVAALHETEPERVNAVYATTDAINWYLCAPVFAGMAAGAPLVSHLWIGWFEPAFVVFVGVLAAGWFLNALAGPAFFLLLGTGQMGGVLASHVTMAVVNAAGGVVLGLALGGYGVAAAWAAALAAGAAHLLLRLRRERGIPLRLPAGVAPTVAASAGGLAAASAVLLWGPPSVGAAVLAPLVLAVVLAVPMWRAPYRERLARLLRRALPA